VYLENVVFDALDPQRLGRFWEAVVGGETLTDVPEGFETRMRVPEGPALDLCFPRVPEAPAAPPRVRLDVDGGERPQDVVERLVALGARRLDAAEPGSPSVVLGDVQDNPFGVRDRPRAHADTGPIAAAVVASGDPARDGDLWAWLTGWAPVAGAAAVTLRHASRRGPLLELVPESEPKGAAKNRLHLDVRLEAGDDPDEVARGIADRGGRALDHAWGPLPWRVYADGSGNEFCVLPARG
jgi:hypothetical protein